ncbi:MAG: ketoacid-CoA transferase [Candidatus Thorarchaeota archaeon]|nr:ketoacid-CoA transferase [Candidatus Thorarchaeota archaeon]
MNDDHSRIAMMAIAAARRITNGDTVFCGTGLPLLAAMTAKKTHAPECVVFFETGALDPDLLEIPLSVADPRVMYRSSHNGGLADAFAFMQNKRSGSDIVGILSSAQIDPYGNLNSTCIGDYKKPDIRLPGSGGACDVASLVGRTLIFMKHERRRFVNELDYMTSPGWLEGGESRQEAGYIRGGPEHVITSLGVFAFDDVTKRMYLEARYDEVQIDDIERRTGFDIALDTSEVEPLPTEEELGVLYCEVDPNRYYL